MSTEDDGRAARLPETPNSLALDTRDADVDAVGPPCVLCSRATVPAVGVWYCENCEQVTAEISCC